jgi:shikimate dehydrogenase
MSDILFPAFLDNQVSCETERYAAILGLAPSKGARSPSLWNAAYAAAGADAVMHPFDVTEANLAGLVSALKADPRYIGGSVAVPHKQGLLPLLDRLEPEAERIGAVNAIYRDGADLVGANTDGAGALAQLRGLVDDLGSRHALVLGLGGAGLAVAAYLAENVASLRLANRTAETAQTFADRLGGKVKAVPLPRSSADLRGVNLIVNCTSIGFQDGDQGSSLGDNSEALLDAMPDDTVIYDIIYQPAETELLRQAKVIGLMTLNGLGMNQDQAVIAFEKANPGLSTIDEIRHAMQSVG